MSFFLAGVISVFTLTYAGLARGRLPGLRTDRTGIALSGAAFVQATGLVSFADAKPIIPAMPAEVQETAWLALAMSSTLAGNLTVLGSVANLIVVECARQQGVSISLLDDCRVGVPVTLLTLLIGGAWLRFVPY